MKTNNLLVLILFPFFLQAQKKELKLKLTLQQAVSMARENSIAALQAATLKETRYWQYRNYQSDYLPQVSLDASLPDFTRNNVAVTQPDGTVEFRPVANDNSQLNLGITQPLRFTGGQIFMRSDLLRFHDFDRKQTRYSGSPLILGFSQPLFSFNSFSWDKKIEPLKFEESKKKYTEDLEYIGKQASILFFNLLIAQINHEIAVKNKKNNDALYKIGGVKAGMGKLSRDELMQLKLASLNAGKALSQADFDMESATLNFKFYIGNKNNSAIELILPEKPGDFEMDISKAIGEARKNKHQTVEFRRTLLEAQKEVARAHGDNGFNASLFATFGLSNKADDIPGIYSNPKDQQTLRIGVHVPILDWGRSAARIKTAQANQKLLEYSIAMQENNFDQEIYTQVKQFRLLRGQMQNNVEADKTAQERYEIARNRYVLGDLSITDLNIALQEKDQAKRDYIMSLRNFWDAYYNIRVLTLYDFETGNRIGTSD
jgi:outer membrane protein